MDVERLKAEVMVGEARDVDPDHILRDLARLQRALHGRGGSAPGLHLTIMNLVVACSTPEEARGLGAELLTLSAEFPCRALVAVFDPPAEEAGQRIWASAANHPARVSQTCCEQVTFYCPGSLSGRVPSLMLATMHPDLPTLLYWRGEPPFRGDLMDQMVEPCQRVVFDSRVFPRPQGLSQIRALVEDPYRQEQVFSDLAWGAIEPWREEIASLFDPPDPLSQLDLLRSVGVDYRPGGWGLPTPPLLLGGWLARRLGWKDPVWRSQEGNQGWDFRGRRGPVALRLVPRPEREDAEPGGIVGFRASTAEGRRFEVEGVRARRRFSREAAGVARLTREGRARVELLGPELSAFSRDPIYQEALQGGVELLTVQGGAGR